MVLVLAAGVRPACAEAAVPPESVVARVGERTVTAADLASALSRRGRAGAVPKADGVAEVRAVLDQLVQAVALSEEARAAGYASRPEVRRALDAVLAGALERDRLEPGLEKLTLPEGAVEEYWRAHPQEFQVPRRVRGAVVYVKVPAKADAKARAERRRRTEGALDQARRLPAGSAGLGKVAVEHSDDQATRYRGGDTGWLTESEAGERWGAQVKAALFSLDAPGALAPLVEAPEGFYVVRLTEIAPAAVRPLVEVRDQLGYILLERKKDEMTREFRSGVVARAGARVDEELLGQVAREHAARTAGNPPAVPPPLPGE